MSRAERTTGGRWQNRKVRDYIATQEAAITTSYIHHRIRARPLAWQATADALAAATDGALAAAGGALYGTWRSQIGRPRDEVNAITTWADPDTGMDAMHALLGSLDCVAHHIGRAMTATLRPSDATPPRRQGNYAFRSFETPAANWEEFLALCASAWPGFESAYDSQVIGLWRYAGEADPVESLLLTRRPDLAMWERSKLPRTEAEAEVRRKLSRRYDLCTSTVVSTATLLTATDARDTARWT